jgi:hypothetical protein
MSAAPIENLELRALAQRDRIRKTTLELIAKVDQTKEQLTPRHLVHQYFSRTSVVLSTVGLLLGYAVAGVFTRD